MSLICVSLMTSSLYPNQGEVMAYSAYDFFHGDEVSGKCEFTKYDEKSLSKNGYSQEEWYNNGQWIKGVRNQPEAVQHFLSLGHSRSTIPTTSSRGNVYYTWKMVTYNAMFTTDYLFNWCNRFDVFGKFDPKVVDLMDLAIILNPDLPDHRFDTVCRHLIPTEYGSYATTDLWKPEVRSKLIAHLLSYYSALWHGHTGYELPVVEHVRQYI